MSIHSQIQGNVTKTYVIMSVFVAFVVVAAYVLGVSLGVGMRFMWIAVLFSVISSFVSYYWGDKLVLAMSGAKPANRKQHFDFYTVAENLAIAAGLPKPKLYVIDDTAMNAFATGRDPQHAVVCATTGILTRLERRELEGVIAHELSHIKNFDTRLMAVVAVLVGTIAFLADMFLRNLWWGRGRDRENDRGAGQIMLVVGIVLAIITPIIATLIQLAISRKREFLADASGALLTRYPSGLASALRKISQYSHPMARANHATAHLFISNPFGRREDGSVGFFTKIFSTHPSVEERVKALLGTHQ